MYLPIIMLHHVLDDADASIAPFAITPKKFTELLDCIEESGFEITTFEEIILKGFSTNELKNKVVITFDDCPTSLFDFAIPELLRRKAKAVFYMPTAYIGKYNSWDVEAHNTIKTPVMDELAIKKLADLGMEVGTHSHHHIKLSNISAADAFKEVNESKLILENILQKPVYSIAYPYGEIPKDFKASLKRAGYNFGLSIYSPSQHRFAMRRIGIYQYDSRSSIHFKMSKSYHILRNMASPIRQVKKMMEIKKGL